MLPLALVALRLNRSLREPWCRFGRRVVVLRLLEKFHEGIQSDRNEIIPWFLVLLDSKLDLLSIPSHGTNFHTCFSALSSAIFVTTREQDGDATLLRSFSVCVCGAKHDTSDSSAKQIETIKRLRIFVWCEICSGRCVGRFFKGIWSWSRSTLYVAAGGGRCPVTTRGGLENLNYCWFRPAPWFHLRESVGRGSEIRFGTAKWVNIINKFGRVQISDCFTNSGISFII